MSEFRIRQPISAMVPIQPNVETGLPPDWEIRWSRTQQQIYCFNVKTRESTWEVPVDCNTDLLIPYIRQFIIQHGQANEQGQALLERNLAKAGLNTDSISTRTVDAPAVGGPDGPADESELIRCAHILVKHTGSRNPRRLDGELIQRTQQEAFEKLSAIWAEVGADPVRFRERAVAESDCPSARNGGDLGIFWRGRLQPEIEQAAYKLEEGQFSDIVSSESGLHLLYRIKLEPRQIKQFFEHISRQGAGP